MQTITCIQRRARGGFLKCPERSAESLKRRLTGTEGATVLGNANRFGSLRRY